MLQLIMMTVARICWFGDEDDMNGEVGSYDRNKDAAPVITTTPQKDEHQGYPEPEVSIIVHTHQRGSSLHTPTVFVLLYITIKRCTNALSRRALLPVGRGV